MRWLVVTLALLVSASALAEQIPAWLASSKVPTPTFKDVHRAYMRIVVNESGFKSRADQDGILQALLYGNGGGRKMARTRHGQGYGLDYTKLMYRMIRHSKRTFPANSRFLPMTTAQRAWLRSKQTRQNKWTSTMKLDCSEPAGWPEKKLDGTGMDPWAANFGSRCRLVVASTRSFLRGEFPSNCELWPSTWGSHRDVVRRGGPLDQGWTQVNCNAPGMECADLTKQELRNSEHCARNTFWRW